MFRRPAKPSLTGHAFGHASGVFGAMMALNAIATSIDPHYLQLFPLGDTGIQQTSAALIGVGLIALGAWLLADRVHPAKAKIDPPETH
jgi:LPXTG-motif cell wall-anchored protein